MKAHLATLLAAGLLAGCSTGGEFVHEHAFQRGIVPAVDVFSVEAAERLCGIDSLTQQRDQMISEVRTSTFDSDQVFGPDERSEADTRTETQNRVSAPPYLDPPSEAVELVRAFVTDLDASYRFATQSCQAYAMCMHQRGYNEDDCSASRGEWSRAQDRFSSMSDELSELRLDIATQCPECTSWGRRGGYRPLSNPYDRPRHYGSGRRHHGSSHDGRYVGGYILRDRGHQGVRHQGSSRRHHPPRRHYDEDDCDGILGDVFTTETCPRPARRGCDDGRC
ncbi:MAG: hypothetical protein AAFX09_10640 [Pseudomonadota bacterium]